MSIVRFRLLPLVLVTLAASACGAKTPAPLEPPPPEPPPAESSAVTSEDGGRNADETWSGEKTPESPTPSAAHASPGAAEPSEVAGKAPETRTMDVIRTLVMQNRKAARQCYDDARKAQKDLKGDVVIHFVLDPEGKVKSAELNQERSTLKEPKVSDCVIAVVKAIQFPKSSRGMETSTNYPFNFTP